MTTLDFWLLIKSLHLLPQLYFNTLSQHTIPLLHFLWYRLPDYFILSPRPPLALLNSDLWPLGNLYFPQALTSWQHDKGSFKESLIAVKRPWNCICHPWVINVNESSPCCNQALSVFTPLKSSLIHSEAGYKLDFQHAREIRSHWPFWPMHHFYKNGKKWHSCHQWLLYVWACSVSESGIRGFTAGRKGERWLDWWGVAYLKGFSPVCVRMWLLSVVAPANARPQYPHLNGLSLEWVTTWFLKSDGWEKDWEQWPHW